MDNHPPNKPNRYNNYPNNSIKPRHHIPSGGRSYPPTRGGHFAGRHFSRGGRSSVGRGGGRWETTMRGGGRGGRGPGRGGFEYGGRFNSSSSSPRGYLEGSGNAGSDGEAMGGANANANANTGPSSNYHAHPQSNVTDGDEVMSMKSGSTGGGDAQQEVYDGNYSTTGGSVSGSNSVRRHLPPNRDRRSNNSNPNWHPRSRPSFEPKPRQHFSHNSSSNANNNREISFRPKQVDYESRGSQDSNGPNNRDKTSNSISFHNRNDGNGKTFHPNDRSRDDTSGMGQQQRFLRRRSHSPPQRPDQGNSISRNINNRSESHIQPSFKRPRFNQNDLHRETLSSSSHWNDAQNQDNLPVTQRFIQRSRQADNEKTDNQPRISSQNENYSGSNAAEKNNFTKPQSTSTFSSFLSMAASSSPFVKANSDSNRDTDKADPMQTYLQKRSAANASAAKPAYTKSSSVIDSEQSKSAQTVSKNDGRKARSPSPEPLQAPSHVAAWARMLDSCAQMEFAYVKYCVMSKKVEAVQDKIKFLESQPTGEAAYIVDLKALEDETGIYDEISS